MTHDITETQPRRRTRALAILLTAVSTLLLTVIGAGPASALSYQTSGSQDLRGFVRSSNPHFACSTGKVVFGNINVTAPSNWARTNVYITNTIYRYNSATGQWDHYYNDSPLRGGKTFAGGESYTFSAQTFTVASGYYYYLEQEVDWHYNGGVSTSKTTLVPNLASDYSASYRYQGNGYGYCYA